MYSTCRTVSWNVIILNNINHNIVNRKQYTMLDLRFLNSTRNCKVKYDQTKKCLTRQWKFERLKHFLILFTTVNEEQSVDLKVHFNRHFTQQRPQRIYLLNVYEKLVKYKKDNVVTSTDYKINVKVVSRYIALGHDTYREPPYRYCIDISPYRLIPNRNLVMIIQM